MLEKLLEENARRRRGKHTVGTTEVHSIVAMLGRHMCKVEVNTAKDELRFTDDEGYEYVFYHEQDCCESVFIEEIIGDLDGLTCGVITEAEETIHYPTEAEIALAGNGNDSETWTFYKFNTDQGNPVTIRWRGESNGYYSEKVDFQTNRKKGGWYIRQGESTKYANLH
jgi:hypothetical protein